MATCVQKFGLSMNAFHLPFSDGSMQQVVEVQPADGHLTKHKWCFYVYLSLFVWLGWSWLNFRQQLWVLWKYDVLLGLPTGGSLPVTALTLGLECTGGPRRAVVRRWLRWCRFFPANATTPTWFLKTAASPALSRESVSGDTTEHIPILDIKIKLPKMSLDTLNTPPRSLLSGNPTVLVCQSTAYCTYFHFSSRFAQELRATVAISKSSPFYWKIDVRRLCDM